MMVSNNLAWDCQMFLFFVSGPRCFSFRDFILARYRALAHSYTHPSRLASSYLVSDTLWCMF